MQWYNEASNWQEKDGIISITTDPDTDFWRVTRHDFIADNAHFYYQSVQGDFVASVKFSGEYNALYDQAGLMARLDEKTWIKCGIEYVDGVQYASAVITRDFSDWSIVPLAGSPKTAYIKLQRIGTAVEVSYSLDGTSYSMIRQGYLTDADLQVGLICASPKGQGFTTRFEDFVLE